MNYCEIYNDENEKLLRNLFRNLFTINYRSYLNLSYGETFYGDLGIVFIINEFEILYFAKLVDFTNLKNFIKS